MSDGLERLAGIATALGMNASLRFNAHRRLWTASLYDGNGVRVTLRQHRDPHRAVADLFQALREKPPWDTRPAERLHPL